MDDRSTTRDTGGPRSNTTLMGALLVCGALSSLLYVVTDILAAMRWEGYSYVDSMVSQLLAIGTPTRSFIVPPMTLYNVLVILFGIGVLASAGRARALRATGVVLIAYGILSHMGLVFFSLRYTGGEVTGGGTAHAVVSAALVVLMLSFIGLGSGADGRRFRVYTILTVLAVVAGGILSGAQGGRLAANEPTPWLGVTERANIYLTLLWVAAFALVLLRRTARQSKEDAVS